ncbi:MAG: M1 family aminopeptidase [Janthinobacterium lividum]
MLWEVIKFELKYRLNRPATYIYFSIFLLLAFLAVSWNGIQFGGDIGKIKQNSSIVIFNIAGVFSLIPGLFIASAIMGVPIIRDFEYKMESLIFTTNINKSSYLIGRFLGSFIILILISFGFVLGTYIGCHMPWIDKAKLLPVTFGQFFKPWLVLIVSNMFVFSCLFFASGALSRKMLFVYLQAIVLLAIYIVVQTLVGDVENIRKAAIIDPFGYYPLDAMTRYWTVAEKNTLTIPFTGLLLLNRLLWLSVGIASFIITYSVFKFRAVYTGLYKKKAVKGVVGPVPDAQPIPFSAPVYNANTWLNQVWALTRLYFKEIVRSVPFIGISLIGIILIAINAEYATTWYGQELYPLSSLTAGFIAAQVSLIISIMVLFYCGEIVWKENEIRFNQIFDALPVGYSVPVLSKFLAMAGAILVYVLLMIPVGAIIQLFKGFHRIELDVYLKVLMLRIYVPMLIYIAMSIFIQSIFSNKFIGYAIAILFYIYIIFAPRMKVFYDLLIPNSGGVGNYSDMNGFAATINHFVVLKIFWMAIAGILLGIAVLFYPRGTDTAYSFRMKNARNRFGSGQKFYMAVCLFVAVLSGSYYYYNTNILNRYRNPEQQKDLQAAYEKEIKPKYGKLLQPSVVNVVGTVDLFPEKGNLNLNAKVTYKNLMHVPIRQLLLQEPADDLLHYSKMNFSKAARLVKNYPDYYLKIYQLAEPLLPGDSLQLELQGKRSKKDFTNNDDNQSYVTNGTFINNTDIFPQLGYDRNLELGDTEDRQKRGLKEQQGLPLRTDTLARMVNLFQQRGHTGLDLTISTAPDQIAISPGYLKNQWKKDDRAYFHYQMDKPIFNFFNIISGKFAVKRDKWHNVNLEIYYHKDHSYNLNTMMTSLKDGLNYDSKNFSPFLYQQMRIIEFPRYRTFAQSFPNTVPFSEAIGFIFRNKKDKLDMAYYVTAHELGHQWWGHQVCEANTVGNQMFSESLAQYSALMLLKKTLPLEELRRYLKYELDGYLQGRSVEKKNENPLDQTDNQQYIHYQKGTLANFAMQDYIGEDNMNKALRKLIANYGNKDIYPTSDVLTGYLKEVTPDSLKYVVDDLYSKITLFENRVINPTAKKVAGGYQVTLPVQTVKYYADRSGNEKTTPIKDYIDIGVFTMDKNGKEKLTYLQRQKFTKEKNTITVFSKEKPVRAGIDPVYKLVDRNTDDNTALVSLD